MLSFRLGEQVYALPITHVVEVAAMVAHQPVMSADPALIGMVNRHGSALLLLDLRQVMGKPTPPITAQTLFIVATDSHGSADTSPLIGLVVDAVIQVIYTTAPAALPDGLAYIHGVVSHDGELIQVVNVQPLLKAYLPAVSEG